MNKFEEKIVAQMRRVSPWEKKPVPTEEEALADLHENGMTIGELIRAVLGIDDEADAKGFYDGYLEHMNSVPEEKRQWNGKTAEEVVRSNIGWCFGEGMTVTQRAMWVKVCDASHPVFGRMEIEPSGAEALAKGIAVGKRMRAEHDRRS